MRKKEIERIIAKMPVKLSGHIYFLFHRNLLDAILCNIAIIWYVRVRVRVAQKIFNICVIFF